MNNQEKRVLQYLFDFGSITSLEAMRDLGVMRLASRICDLRHKGIPIQKRTESTVNRYGERCVIVRYFIKQESEGA